MCGRFTLSTPGEIVAEVFGLAQPPELSPRYNIAPTQPAPTVSLDRKRSERVFRHLRWGLIPSWAEDPVIGSRMINARAETAASKPSFRAAFRHRRCLVLADGFYEWQKLGRRKQPFYIQMSYGRPFAFAGLWEHWEAPDGSAIDSCTLLTTEPNELLRPLHDRMPVILGPNDHAAWLDPNCIKEDGFASLLKPFPSSGMSAFPVGTFVNNPGNDSPKCVEKTP